MQLLVIGSHFGFGSYIPSGMEFIWVPLLGCFRMSFQVNVPNFMLLSTVTIIPLTYWTNNANLTEAFSALLPCFTGFGCGANCGGDNYDYDDNHVIINILLLL